ncbi:MAG TPA: carboxypeptidase regulatory-like domain-containing protein, partial [Gemmatimonadaceae bacterium]
MRFRVCVLLALAGPAATAQGVRVRVVDEQANAPIPGALLILKRSGRTLDQSLTRADGSRIITAAPDNGYTLEVRRVGYAPFVSRPFSVARADTQVLDLRVPSARAALAPPNAGTARRAECRSGEAGRERAGELWQQMRTALLSVEIAQQEALEPLAISRYERTLGLSGAVLGESRANNAALGSKPFRTASPPELSRSGFVVTDTMGQPAFRAPDAAVFLSSEFASDHCFDVVAGSGPTAGLIGLSFSPVRGRKVTDVEGALWADPESSQLRFAQFTYRFPGAGAGDVRDANGRILFEQLGSQNWIAREWEVRTPVQTPSGQLLGYREEGGEALSVTPRMAFVMDSVANSRKVPGIITGVVTDSLTGKGFAGARVWLDSAGLQTRTDSRGMYFLRGVPPGEHLVRFSHPMLDSIGIRPQGRVIKAVSESMVDANLGGPSLRTLVGATCGDTLAVMTGRVLDALKHAPVDSASVTLAWIDVRLDANRRPVLIMPRETVASTDVSGRYGACVPQGVELTVSAKRGVARTAGVDGLVDERRLSIMDFLLDTSAPDSVSGSAELRGAVKYQDGTPIKGAIVTLSDPEISASTDSAGRFRIPAIPGGTRALDARAIGHAPQRMVLDVKPGEVTDVSIYLRKVTMLDPVIVRAAASDRTAQTLEELADRQRKHQGSRMSQSQLRAFGDVRLDVVIRSLPYANLRTSPRSSLML